MHPARDRRRAPRLNVGLPIELHVGKGLTRNVSTSGLYFETEVGLTVGARLSFALILPHGSPLPIRVECEGEVVRIEPLDDRVGVAATITSARLIRESHSA